MSAHGILPSVTVRRTIEASAEELFDAWLDPEAVADWMRPAGIERTRARIDPRAGGAFEIVMHHATEGEIVHTPLPDGSIARAASSSSGAPPPPGRATRSSRSNSTSGAGRPRSSSISRGAKETERCFSKERT